MPLSEKIIERLRREFFPEDFAKARKILEQWQTKDCAWGEAPSRMRHAALNLAKGQIDQLKAAIRYAKQDFRDLLWWGEYAEWKHLRSVIYETDEEHPFPEENAFLKNISKDPNDTTTRLVYADWLEDRDDPRAEYLRLLCEWLRCSKTEEKGLIEKERELREGISIRWLAEIRGIPVMSRKTLEKRGG